jgi:hypothetical protein
MRCHHRTTGHPIGVATQPDGWSYLVAVCDRCQQEVQYRPAQHARSGRQTRRRLSAWWREPIGWKGNVTTLVGGVLLGQAAPGPWWHHVTWAASGVGLTDLAWRGVRSLIRRARA